MSYFSNFQTIPYDLNGDGVVTPDEIKRAEELLKKAKQQHVNTGMLKTLNQFKTLV